MKGSEEYQTLKESLANVIHDVNSLVKDGEMTIDGQTIGLEFFLGGDYKVSYLRNLLLVNCHFVNKSNHNLLLMMAQMKLSRSRLVKVSHKD